MEFRCRKCWNIVVDIRSITQMEHFIAHILHGRLALVCRECGREFTFKDYLSTMVERSKMRRAIRG